MGRSCFTRCFVLSPPSAVNLLLGRSRKVRVSRDVDSDSISPQAIPCLAELFQVQAIIVGQSFIAKLLLIFWEWLARSLDISHVRLVSSHCIGTLVEFDSVPVSVIISGVTKSDWRGAQRMHEYQRDYAHEVHITRHPSRLVLLQNFIQLVLVTTHVRTETSFFVLLIMLSGNMLGAIVVRCLALNGTSAWQSYFDGANSYAVPLLTLFALPVCICWRVVGFVLGIRPSGTVPVVLLSFRQSVVGPRKQSE
jgi:hypothetical protein